MSQQKEIGIPKTDKMKHIVQTKETIKDLNKKFEEIHKTLIDELETIQDKIIDYNDQDKTNQIKLLVKYTRKNNKLNLIIENQKLLKIIEENFETITNTYYGQIP